MIRVAAITSGKNVPSARFRIRQHIFPLREAGVEVREYVPAVDKYARFPNLSLDLGKRNFMPVNALWWGIKLSTRVPAVIGSWTAQITWLERELCPGYLTLELMLKRPYVFDVDDPIWLGLPFGRSAAIRIANNAEVVLAGNNYIAEWIQPHAKDVRIVPTAIDTERFLARRLADSHMDRPFVIGWTGISSNYKYLYEIERALENFLKNTNDAVLLVVADEPPRFCRLQPRQVRFIKWSPVVEAEAVREMDVGLMPLSLNEWTRGKCSFKMLQYMASGVPVVVSPVGMNAELISMGEIGFSAENNTDWIDALYSLYKDRDLAHQLGVRGRSIVEQHFSRDVISAQIAQIFKGLA